MEAATKELVASRIAICTDCPSSKFTYGVGLTCGNFLRPTEETCGCKLSWKVRLKNQKCPQNKWPKVTGDDF